MYLSKALYYYFNNLHKVDIPYKIKFLTYFFICSTYA